MYITGYAMDTFKHPVDSVYAQLGWGRKSDFVRSLKRDYIEGTDYICEPPKSKSKTGRPMIDYFITENCYKLFIARDRTRKLNRNLALITTNSLTYQYVTRLLPKAEETITFIMQVFEAKFKCSPEYQIPGIPEHYRVDLYIHEPNIIIECDEFDHQGYDPDKEKQRTSAISNAIPDVKWIRYNPDAQHFKLSSVIQTIIQEAF